MFVMLTSRRHPCHRSLFFLSGGGGSGKGSFSQVIGPGVHKGENPREGRLEAMITGGRACVLYTYGGEKGEGYEGTRACVCNLLGEEGRLT